MHQLSRISLLVPVLTALQNRVARGFSKPKVVLRLSRSAKICDTRKAVSAEYKRPANCGLRIADCGLKSTDFGLWTLDFGLWTSSNVILSGLHTPPSARVR